MFKKTFIGILIVAMSLFSISVYGSDNNRVIYEFDQVSDQSGYLTLKWFRTSNEPIQITGYTIVNPNRIEVSYQTGGRTSDTILIRNNQIQMPFKIVLRNQNNNKEKLIDLPEDIEIKDHIIHLYDRGIVSGYTDGTFLPNNTVTREEFTTMIVLAARYVVEKEKESPFKDVKNTDWSKEYIVTLASKGILVGDGAGSFNPKSDITIGEVLAVIDRTFSIYTGKQQVFENVVNNHWSNGNYNSLVKQGIIHSKDAFSTPYEPNKKATREECAVLISRILEQIYKTR
jgi:hypothetical protein